MKKLVVKNLQDCAACRSCETACAKAYYKTENIEYAMLSVGGDANGISITTCTQCGKCAKVCPVGAITKNNAGVYTINRKTCIGCLASQRIK